MSTWPRATTRAASVGAEARRATRETSPRRPHARRQPGLPALSTGAPDERPPSNPPPDATRRRTRAAAARALSEARHVRVVPVFPSFPSFPNPVDEVSARLVAAGVVVLGAAYAVTGWLPLVAVLAYGFVARVLAGPRFSPLGLLVTRGLRPRLPLAPRPVPGPPKRFAQGIGAALSVLALVLALVGAGRRRGVVALVVVAATLESAAGFCVGCSIFAALMRRGVIPSPSARRATTSPCGVPRPRPDPRPEPSHPS